MTKPFRENNSFIRFYLLSSNSKSGSENCFIHIVFFTFTGNFNLEGMWKSGNSMKNVLLYKALR